MGVDRRRANLKKGEVNVSKMPGNILLAALLVLLLGACGPEEQAATSENAEGQAAEESGELEMIELPRARTAEAGAAIDYGFTRDDSSGAMTSYLELVLNDNHNFWAEQMVEGGYSMPYLDYSLPYAGETETTSCISTGSTGPDDALYCAQDDAIVFSNELAMNMWQSEVEANGDPEAGEVAGNFAVAAAMAHLYGHALQEEWGWLPVQEGQESLVPVKRTELNADCLAGVWAQSAYDSELLDAAAVESAMETLSDAGQFEGIEDEDHGTPADRTAAFMTGFESGMANSCDEYVLSDNAAEQ